MLCRGHLLPARQYLKHLPSTVPRREVVPEHEVAAPLVQDADQVPQVLRLGLDGCCRPQQHMFRPGRDLAHEGQQLVRRTRIGAETLPRAGLVRLVQDHQAEAQAQQVLLLGRMSHHQPGRDDANAQRAARDVLAAGGRNGPFLVIEPDLAHRVPTCARDAQLVQHLGLPLLAQRGRGKDHHRPPGLLLAVGQQAQRQCRGA